MVLIPEAYTHTHTHIRTHIERTVSGERIHVTSYVLGFQYQIHADEERDTNV